MRISKTHSAAAVLSLATVTLPAQSAFAILGGFETADGYTTPFTRDVWSYDAGQTGALFTPAQYNTGRWQELLGNSSISGAQYASQHGFGGGGANSPPFALAVRNLIPAPGPSYDMTLQYDVGVDDLGVAPTTPLNSASITFDICPGLTTKGSGGFDTTFNNVPAFSLSFGGTDPAPGATIGFTDQDPSNFNLTQIFHQDGGTFVSQPIPWTKKFDQITIDINFVSQTFDMTFTPDSNISNPEFTPGAPSITVVSGAALTTPINTLEQMYFRTHTDPGDGTDPGGLEKSYLDNFSFVVKPVPEPASLSLLAMGLTAMIRRGRN